MDADLGAPNLHTFLGMKDAHPNMGDFLAGQIPSLDDAVRPTPLHRLGLVRGPENTFFVANVNHYRKLKLMRHVKTLQRRPRRPRPGPRHGLQLARFLHFGRDSRSSS